LPDWMLIRMASSISIKLGPSVGKQLLIKYRGERRDDCYPRNATVTDQQICVDIARILGNNPSRYNAAKQFYLMLNEMHFCKPKSDALNVLFGFWVKKNNIEKAVDELEDLLHRLKFKSIGSILFVVMSLICSRDSLVMKYAKTRLQRICIIGCVLLDQNLPIRFAELLHKEEFLLCFEAVRFICSVAASKRRPDMLFNLLDCHELFKLDNKARNYICNALVVIYGKKREIDGLNKIWHSVNNEKNLDDFLSTMNALKHFYKCLRVHCPKIDQE
uniref:Pentatricopeptide repeat-containing protein n=1 Tax=Dracunculus medinensis TaxID=318479 RepID=A0A0N4UGT3_DRAME